mmetsp:Transcript_21445/g.40351  ORF Transcript_21445/g.40351 Transcript_21445/m.40351 type:complete len:213 (+) Transcript_21445:600-1238(+)
MMFTFSKPCSWTKLILLPLLPLDRLAWLWDFPAALGRLRWSAPNLYPRMWRMSTASGILVESKRSCGHSPSARPTRSLDDSCVIPTRCSCASVLSPGTSTWKSSTLKTTPLESFIATCNGRAGFVAFDDSLRKSRNLCWSGALMYRIMGTPSSVVAAMLAENPHINKSDRLRDGCRILRSAVSLTKASQVTLSKRWAAPPVRSASSTCSTFD